MHLKSLFTYMVLCVSYTPISFHCGTFQQLSVKNCMSILYILVVAHKQLFSKVCRTLQQLLVFMSILYILVVTHNKLFANRAYVKNYNLYYLPPWNILAITLYKKLLAKFISSFITKDYLRMNKTLRLITTHLHFNTNLQASQ